MGTLLRNPVQGKEKREMGNLLSFVRSLGDKSVSEIDDKFKLFIDFEKDKIENEGEQKVHDLSVKVDGKIGESSEALKFLANYGPGGSQLIKDAISKPGDPEIQEEVWEKMLPLIHNLTDLKQSYSALNEMIPEILGQLWEEKKDRSSSALLDVFRERETLLIQLGKILDVNMKFDSLKMLAPSIPNDIAYVKRQATLRRKDNRTTMVEPDQLGELSMFYIEHNPAMKSVIKTITDFFRTAESKSESLDLIVVFCKVCMKVLDTDIRGKFGNVATVMMVHRVMVATALLYDHLHPDGIFVRDSPISIIIILELLEDEAGLKRRRTRSRPVQEKSPVQEGKGGTDGVERSPSNASLTPAELTEQANVLLNVLKYSNKHLSSPSTPKSVQQAFNRIL